ncbi:MAG: hypothetical protein M1818_002559 [Claussenomyces sp. TS43310]|nr:MAG: hypothetical protein M1818_002559 [Claussenomyces sp. TS43310]
MESTFRFGGSPPQFKTPSAASRPKPSHGTPTPNATPSMASNTTPNGTPGEASKTRKPRITVTEHDHLVLMRLCVEKKEEMREGNKMGFWNSIRLGFKDVTGKELSSPRHPVEKLVEDRQRQLDGIVNRKPDQSDGELQKLIDEWIVHLNKVAEIEAANGTSRVPGPRSASRVRVLAHGDEPKETPIPTPLQKRPRSEMETPAPPPLRPRPQPVAMNQYGGPSHPPAPRMDVPPMLDDQVVNLLDTFIDEQDDMNRGASPHKRQRGPQERFHQDRPYPEPPQRVIVEGALSKTDWLEIISHYAVTDPRIVALDAKVDNLVEMTKRTHQMLVQLLKNQARRPGTGGSEVPGNSDAHVGSQSLPP